MRSHSSFAAAARRRLRHVKRPRRYHLADDAECTFDYELPDWLVGAD